MNANENSPQTNARLHRIKIVSRIVRYVVLGCLALAVGNWLFRFVLMSPPPWTGGYLNHTLLMMLLEVVLCLWYWKLAKLFHFYERGLIFTAETIRCVKTLGGLCVINWLLMTTFNTLTSLFPPPPLEPPTLPPGVAVHSVKIVESNLHMGFFSFYYGRINLGMLLAGTVIIVIAWIMDEGRKIQEEQELTV